MSSSNIGSSSGGSSARPRYATRTPAHQYLTHSQWQSGLMAAAAIHILRIRYPPLPPFAYSSYHA